MTPLLLSLLTTAVLPSAARIIAGNRNRVPTAFAAGGPNVMKFDGVSHYAPKSTGLTGARAFFENRYAQANGGNSSTSLVAFKLQASLEYPIGGTLYPLTFAGQDEITLNPGDAAWSDSVTVSIPAGAQYRIRTDREHIGVGASYNQLANCLISSASSPGKQDHATSGSDNTVHKSRGQGGTYSNFSGTTFTYTATLVEGVPALPGKKSALILGDSISRGSGDTKTSAPLQQGDWLNGTSPTALYPNLGNVGWVETSIGDSYPYHSMAVPSRQVVTSAVNITNLGPQFDAMDQCPPTHVVLALGVNDLMLARTPAQVLGDLIAAVTMIKNRFPGCKVYVSTITPVTNTTDAYATGANQTFTGTPPAGGSVTWSNFNGTDDTTGRRLLNSNIRSGAVTGSDGVIDVAMSVEDASDPRKWRTDLGVPTVDGVHPQAVLHRQIASDANLPGRIAA